MLNGGEQTVRGLTFEGFATALSFGEVAPETRTGGYVLKNSTFRNGDVPIVFVGFSDDVSTIRNNKFINVTIPILLLGKTVHFRGNSNTTPDPSATLAGQPFNAGVILPEFLSGINVCENNVFEENTIVENADGFIMFGDLEGDVCRNNVFRGNTFIRQRVFTDGDNGSMVVLAGGPEGNIEGNRIEENELRGGEGLGIVAFGETHDNLFRNNEFSKMPGGTVTPIPFSGTAIFLGRLTHDNKVVKNEFQKVVHTILDLGTDNFIGKGQGTVLTEPAAALRLEVSEARSPSRTSQRIQLLRELMKN